MELIEFKNLPNTDTPINAENLNHNFNELVAEDSGWINMELINNWGSYTDPYQRAQYRKIGNQVFLRGMILGGKNDTDCVILPEGFRPLFNIYLPIAHDGGVIRTRIYPTGAIKIPEYSNWVSLNGLSFFID